MTKTEILKNIFYNINLNTNTNLCNIMNQNGSDKGNGHHNYTIIYESIFSYLHKKEEIKIFELGLGTNNTSFKSNMGVHGIPGASLRGWKQYFKNSCVYGADIDSNILFEENKIKTFFCDQTDKKSISYLWDQEILKEIKFDVIIDDGLHEYDANICFLENSYYKLKDDGLYIIEDVGFENVPKFVSYFNKKIDFYKNWSFLYIPNKRNDNDNNLIILYKQEN